MRRVTDPHVLAPDHAPTPFTAAQIRDACRPGLTLDVRVDGDHPMTWRTRYLTCDDEGATFERTTDGGSPEPGQARWLELQEHASFPLAQTTIEPERIETPLGVLDCLRYTVRDGDVEKVLWFATSLPGMPVRMTTRRDGRVVATLVVESVS